MWWAAKKNILILLLSILFTTSLVLGITIATQDGMVGENIREYTSGRKCYDPIINCFWCMPSVWSVAGYIFAFLYCGFDFSKLLFYPITVCASSVLCGIIWGLIQLIFKNNQH
jgi:hypothetical protein